MSRSGARLARAVRAPLLIAAAALVPASLLALVSSAAVAPPDEFSCTALLRLAAGAATDPALPAPWRLAADGGALRLTGVSAYSGPPERRAALMPHATNPSDTQIDWVFEGEFPNGAWLSCDYGGGVLRAVRETPKGTSRCTARLTRESPAALSSARFECR